jgi:DNA-binding transcriptional LysR family regulator
MDLKQLKYFYTIVEEGQITSAAKRLHMAQPPLSYQLKALEEELGTKLLHRGSRKIQLTEAGQLLYNRAEQILGLTESTLRELKDYKEGFEGILSLGTVSSSGSSLLLERINKFHNCYGGIKFEIYEGNSFRILDMLNTGLIEIGIVRTPLNLENMNAIYLPGEPMIAAMTEALDWDRTAKIISMSQLYDKPLIIYRRFENL